jgi:hypothetical protein
LFRSFETLNISIAPVSFLGKTVQRFVHNVSTVMTKFSVAGSALTDPLHNSCFVSSSSKG